LQKKKKDSENTFTDLLWRKCYKRSFCPRNMDPWSNTTRNQRLPWCCGKCISQYFDFPW